MISKCRFTACLVWLTTATCLSQQGTRAQQPSPSIQDVYLMCEGIDATQKILLTLNNNNANAEMVDLTLYTVDGQVVSLPPISLEADQSKLTRLDGLLLRKGIVSSLGYLKVSYAGKLMATGAQLTLYPLAGEGGLDSARSLTVDFKDTHRTAVAWFPPHSAATVALSNVSASPITVMSRVTGQDQDHFTLEPHSTRITTISSNTNQLAPSSPFFHDLSFVGPVDSLRVAGYIAPDSGPPLPLRYYDPAASTSPNLTAVGIDTSTPTHVAVYNATSTAYTVAPELRPATDEPSEPITAPSLSVPGHATAYIDIEPALRAFASRSIPLATLTLATTAPAGSLIGALSEEKNTVDAIEDIPLRTSNPPIYMRGFYPLRWTSDYKNAAIVTNASPLPKEISAYVIANGVTYNFAPVQLQPFATHVYDVDAIRANQVADFKGVKIPLSSKSGKFQWAGNPKDNNVGLIGRMEVLSRKDRRASSFSCGGSCPANVTAPVFDGSPFGNFSIGSTTVFTAVEETYDSYGNPVSKPLTGAETGLSSSIPQVLSLSGDSSSTQIPLTANSYGSSNMAYTQVIDAYYPDNGYSCTDNQTSSPGGGTGNVVACPKSVSVGSNTPINITDNTTLHTGYGDMVSMLVSPASPNSASYKIVESVTPKTNSCPFGVFPTITQSTSATFNVGLGAELSDNSNVTYQAIANAFYDQLSITATTSLLPASTASCTATATHNYYCAGTLLGTFTATATITQGTANGGPASIVTTNQQ